jgi:hypothetical protein
VQDKLESFIYRSLEETVRSVMKGAVKMNWFPEAPVSDTVSSYMEQLVLLLKVRAGMWGTCALHCRDCARVCVRAHLRTDFARLHAYTEN